MGQKLFLMYIKYRRKKMCSDCKYKHIISACKDKTEESKVCKHCKKGGFKYEDNIRKHQNMAGGR